MRLTPEDDFPVSFFRSTYSRTLFMALMDDPGVWNVPPPKVVLRVSRSWLDRLGSFYTSFLMSASNKACWLVKSIAGVGMLGPPNPSETPLAASTPRLTMPGIPTAVGFC
jgi:hypothetical protein